MQTQIRNQCFITRCLYFLITTRVTLPSEDVISDVCERLTLAIAHRASLGCGLARLKVDVIRGYLSLSNLDQLFGPRGEGDLAEASLSHLSNLMELILPLYIIHHT